MLADLLCDWSFVSPLFTFDIRARMFSRCCGYCALRVGLESDIMPPRYGSRVVRKNPESLMMVARCWQLLLVDCDLKALLRTRQRTSMRSLRIFSSRRRAARAGFEDRLMAKSEGSFCESSSSLV